MNRINTFIVLAISTFLTLLVLYLFVREQVQPETETVTVPLKMEVYRQDRNPLPSADVYLNQRFLGRTDQSGFFRMDIDLVVGENYTLRIEKENDGYVYGPWETSFRTAAERKKRREREEEPETLLPSLEGEFDVLTEIEKAELGRATLYDKYYFLAILDGNMYYTIRVSGVGGRNVGGAAVIVNGSVEGYTDDSGFYSVTYEGDAVRRDTVQVIKEGEHIWRKSVDVFPSHHLDVDLSSMLLIDLYAYTEDYDVLKGIRGAQVFVNEQWIGKTGRSGYLAYPYENDQGVDGELSLRIEYPEGHYPEMEETRFVVQSDLQRLTHAGFSYNRQPPAPRIAVVTPLIDDRRDALLLRRADELRRGLEDHLSRGGVFSTVSGREVTNLFEQFGLSIGKNGTDWSEIPFLKNEVDGIIFGGLSSVDGLYRVELYGIDYTGKIIGQMERSASLRSFQLLPDFFVQQFKSNFPYEGSIRAIDGNIQLNIGWRHGVEVNDKFYSLLNYYDTIKQDYSTRRVAKLRITEVAADTSSAELETITEGHLLEPGEKVKRFSEPAQALRQLPVTLEVTSGKNRIPAANIYIDDQWTGQTDDRGIMTLTLTESATADVLVYKEGFIPVKIDIKVQVDENLYRVNLQRGSTQLTVDSEPQGALLFINDEFIGNTPFDRKPVELPYGFHRIELKLEGYKDYSQYLKFSERKMDLTRERRIVLYEDILGQAEQTYDEGELDETLRILLRVDETHPDFVKAMEFCGYIYLRHFRQYEEAIACYSRAIDLSRKSTETSVLSYYNYGQACYNRAEELYYNSSLTAQSYYQLALEVLNVVKERRSRLLSSGREQIYQDVLFYVAVSHQKLYYLTNLKEYLTGAHYSWIDYFDFFDNNLFKDSYYEDQHRIAESYREEIKRLQSDD
jgi:hypothetical protein